MCFVIVQERKKKRLIVWCLIHLIVLRLHGNGNRYAEAKHFEMQKRLFQKI